MFHLPVCVPMLSTFLATSTNDLEHQSLCGPDSLPLAYGRTFAPKFPSVLYNTFFFLLLLHDFYQHTNIQSVLPFNRKMT